MTNIIGDVLGFIDNKRSAIEPQYVRAGKPVYTLRDYADMTDLDAEFLLNGGVLNMAERVPTIGRTGNLLRTPRTAYAVNLDIAFDNRVKVVEEGKKKSYVFVTDQRALMEQKSGRIYAKHVVGFIITADKDGNPYVKGTVNIPEDEFLNDFDATFDPQHMEEVMQLINKYRLEHGTAKVVSELAFS